MVPAESFQKVI